MLQAGGNNLKCIRISFRNKGDNSKHHVAADHEGRHAVGEAAPDHEVAGVGKDAGMQARHVADEVVEAVAGHAAGAVQVDAAEAFHDVGVVRDLEIGHDGLTEAFELDVFRVVLSDGHGGVDDVRDDHHGLQVTYDTTSKCQRRLNGLC